MKSVAITLPDGSQKRYPTGTTPLVVAADLGKFLERDAIAAKVNGKLVDLTFSMNADCMLTIVTRDTPEGLEVLRHSTAHLLAQAVKELFPETQVTIGPVTEDGFYYDFDRSTPFLPEDLTKIERQMKEIATRNLPISRHEMNKDQAALLFKNMGENFKVEIIEAIPEVLVSVYQQGEWRDLCRGPHVPNTAHLGAFKLLSIAGAYWRGDERNKMLQRIYGTAYSDQKELDEHLKRLEEAKRRDHRKLGPELGLFMFNHVSPAMPFYLPKGTLLHNLVLDFIRRQMQSAGYQEVICPQLMGSELWATSGHLEHYKQNMFFVHEEGEKNLSLKPMNCPGHALVYSSTKRSYRELPIRFSEFTKVHRNERAGVTHGLLRVRNFSIDDGHIFCTAEQVGSEALQVIQHTYDIYRLFGFPEVVVKLATRPEKSLGSLETWEKAQSALSNSLRDAGKKFSVLEGEGAFYGPKIEFHVKDSIGRLWQCGTIQLDFSLPDRFQLEYTDRDGKSKRPAMIHRAIFGSLERFLGILIEHYAGHLPLWFAPTQVLVLNVTQMQESYCRSLTDTLEKWCVRVENDLRNEKLSYKIREAQIRRIPLMLVIGNKEVETQTVSVRKHNGETMSEISLENLRSFLEPLMKPGTG